MCFRLFLTALLSALLTLRLPASAQPNRFVRVSGNQVLGPDGQPLRLTAANIGGWGLWENWLWGGGFTAESTVKSRLQELLGEAGYHRFVQDYYANFFTEADVIKARELGFNCLRVPFNHRLFAAGNPAGENGYHLLDQLIGWARQHQVYLVLDLHAAPGGQSSYFIADPGPQTLWQSAECRRQTVALWRELAARYRDEPLIAGYDLLNEPNAPNTKQLIDFYRELVTAVRAADPNHLLLLEGNKTARDFQNFPASFDANQLYTFHYYAWFSEKNKAKALSDQVSAIPGTRPVWCGEWGEDTPDNLRQVQQLLSQNPRVCGTAFWTWKRVYKNNNRHPYATINASATWQRLATWLTWHVRKPSEAEAQQGTAEFLQAVKLANCQVARPY